MLGKAFPFSLALMSTFPALASNIEEVPTNEADATKQIVRMIEESVRAEAKNGVARRDAHSKAHGCVQAKFNVLHKLPKEVRVGIFEVFRDYPAWIRYSNGSGKVQEDSVGDARGMAIKIMGVENSESGSQDFVMINHPVFFVRNAADYVEFQKALSEDSPVKFFFPSLNPFSFRLHELRIANEIRSKEVANPLDIQYWSATPYGFGDTAMKFSVRSCSATSPFVETSSPNFLRENMQKHLAQDAACFDFMVQLRKNTSEMPIEDPTVEGANMTRRLSLWRGSQFHVRNSPRQSKWSSAITYRFRPGTPSLSIGLWAVSTVYAKQSTILSPVFAMNSMATSAVNRQASKR